VNRYTLQSMILVGALLAPAVGAAQISCTREDLQAAADQYVTAQTERHTWGGPYVENFDLVYRNRLINWAGTIDRHLSLVDTARCETYTEGLVSSKSNPYAFGARLRLSRGINDSEMETMWSAPGDRGFDIDAYLKNSSNEDWGPIPAVKRDTRKALESVANAYLDALLAGKADVMPWGLPCERRAANGTCQVGVPADAVNIANRHFVVDETMGAVAVLCTIGFDPSTGRVRAADAHLFRIENGRVRFVHAVTHLPEAAAGRQAKIAQN